MTKKEFKALKRGDYVVLGYTVFKVMAYINLGSIRVDLQGPGIDSLTLTISEACCLGKVMSADPPDAASVTPVDYRGQGRGGGRL